MRKAGSRIAAAGLAGMMAVSLLSGCGSTGDSASSAGTESEGGTTAAAANDGKIHIEFFNQKTEIVDILDNLIDEYEEENPNIKIDMVTPANALTVLSTRMASNQTPDVFTNWPNQTMFTEVDAGYIMDLTDTGIMDNIQDVARDQWRYNGGEYAATISYNCSGIWYNVDLFEQAGIDEPPVTWSELLEDCEKLEAAGITPFVTCGKEVDICDRQLMVFLASSMGDSYDEFETAASNMELKKDGDYVPALEAMAEKMVQMIGYSQTDIMGTDQDSATANFANGEGAMMIGGSWLLASVTDANPDINIAMTPIPGDTAEETNTCAYPGDMALCIAADSDVSEEAIAFVKWMTSQETATEYAEAEGNPSCIKGVDYVAPQFSELYADYVTTGKFILNPDCSWTNAQAGSAGVAVQQLYYYQDPSEFPEYLESAFNDDI